MSHFESRDGIAPVMPSLDKSDELLAASGQHHNAPPWNFATALGAQAMLFYQQVLQSADVRILWRKFNRLSERHHAVDGLFGLMERLVLLGTLIFQAESLLKKGFHLTDGIAA